MEYILLILGFYLLIKGADVFVDGSSTIATKKFGIPSIIVGLTIVSLGTSFPELAISVTSALKGNNGMAVGNVLGSNIFNILAVLGATSIIASTVVKKNEVKRDYLVTLLSSLIFLIVVFTTFLGGQKYTITRIDGIFLVLCCIAYVALLVRFVKGGKNDGQADEVAVDGEEIKMMPNLIKIVLGVAGIAFGGDIVVDSASTIGLSWGMSESLVGLTIASIGTSLPELVTSVIAAKKGENDIAIGNVLGSCIFNILLIIGISGAISPMVVASSLIVDFIFLIAIVVLLGAMIFASKKETKVLSKLDGMMFIALYAGYIIYIIGRN